MSVAIGTLRLRSHAGDSPALRLRAARELQRADLAPRTLPPAAILVVRRLADPLPGEFGGDRLRPPAAWEDAVRDALAHSARSAARPDGGGWIPTSADAVLFRDQAELLAALLADRAREAVTSRWWWRHVLRRLGRPAAAMSASHVDLSSVLVMHPREMPAALAHLHRWGCAEPVARKLSIVGAASALAALATAHALPECLVGAPTGTAESDRTAATNGEAGAATSPRGSNGRLLPARAPWSEWLPRTLAEERFAPEIQCLFGVALCLHAAPARLRTAAAVAQAARWWRSVPPLRLDGASAEFEAPLARAVTGAHDAGQKGADGRAVSVRGPTDVNEDDAALVSGTTSDPLGLVTGHRPDTLPGERPLQPTPSAENDSPGGLFPEVANVGSARSSRAPEGLGDRERPGHAGSADRRAPRRDDLVQSTEGEEVARSAFAAGGVQTRLGGILYLIHAIEELRLPGAFQPGWRMSCARPAWAAVDLIARALLGSEFRRVDDDPVWDTLAELAGWPSGTCPHRRRDWRSPASRQGSSDPAYDVPPEWPSRLVDPQPDFAWTTTARRLWVWSRERYLVLHRPVAGGAATDALRRSAAYASHASHRLTRARPSAIPWLPPAALPFNCPARLGRWAAATAPAVLRRVLLALGTNGAPERTRRASASQLLAVPGRLFVTSSHIDFVASLNDADAAVRRAGLDRDPGWLPAYGRVVYLHFE